MILTELKKTRLKRSFMKNTGQNFSTVSSNLENFSVLFSFHLIKFMKLVTDSSEKASTFQHTCLEVIFLLLKSQL